MNFKRTVTFASWMLLVSSLGLSDLVATPGRPPAESEKSGLANSLQMLVVITKDWDELHGKAQPYERCNTNGEWRAVGIPFSVVVGKTGLGWGRGIRPNTNDRAEGPIKHEGDGKAPAGIFALTVSFGYSRRPLSRARMQYVALTPTVACVDDSQSSRYNQIFDTQGVTKDWNSFEQMRRGDELYRWGVVVAHNMDPTVSGAGSCIFLHIWHDPDTGTVGCTAMPQSNIESLLYWLDPAKHPVLVQLPEPQYARYREAWLLPALSFR